MKVEGYTLQGSWEQMAGTGLIIQTEAGDAEQESIEKTSHVLRFALVSNDAVGR
jgi:hypothetical protein